jgi:hypothetical protein
VAYSVVLPFFHSSVVKNLVAFVTDGVTARFTAIQILALYCLFLVSTFKNILRKNYSDQIIAANTSKFFLTKIPLTE